MNIRFVFCLGAELGAESINFGEIRITLAAICMRPNQALWEKIKHSECGDHFVLSFLTNNNLFNR